MGTIASFSGRNSSRGAGKSFLDRRNTMIGRFLTPGVLKQTLLCAVLSIAVLSMAVSPAFAQSEKVVYPFSIQNADGQDPQAGLVLDQAGNLYGTTFGGGPFGWGTVFEIT